MKKSLIIFSIFCFCLFSFNACQQETESISTPVSVEQLADDYLSSFNQLVFDFKESNEAILSRGVEINYAKLKQVNSNEELVTTLKQLGLRVNSTSLEVVMNNLNNISNAAANGSINFTDFETLLNEKLKPSGVLRSGSAIECLQAYDDAIAAAALLTAACAAGSVVFSGGGGVPGCIVFAIVEVASAEAALAFCLKRVRNER